VNPASAEQDKQRPSDEEIELRRQLRTGNRVERAVNLPGGRPAPATAPAQGAKEQ
jgi:hypothetical protein